VAFPKAIKLNFHTTESSITPDIVVARLVPFVKFEVGSSTFRGVGSKVRGGEQGFLSPLSLTKNVRRSLICACHAVTRAQKSPPRKIPGPEYGLGSINGDARCVMADRLKDQGNDLFKQRKFQEAVEKYSEGIAFWLS
jgi:hypothetical protein